KKKRNIINFSYQTHADDIVGKMTIRSLDTEMLAQERGRSDLLLSFGVSVNLPPKVGIISQNHPLAAAWATQVVAAHQPGAVSFTSPKNGTPEENVKVIKKAIAAASGDIVIFAVGHGIGDTQFPSQGGFDAADDAKMRIGGRGSATHPRTFVDVFY